MILRKLSDRDGFRLANGRRQVSCAVCGLEMPLRRATVGHRKARCKDGSNELDNLELQCKKCNQQDGLTYLPIKRDRPSGSYGELRRIVREKNPQLARHPGRIFDNIQILNGNGEALSFTSALRAMVLVEAGAATILEKQQDDLPAVVKLNYLIPGATPANRSIANQCQACGTNSNLSRFNVLPDWHPAWIHMPATHFAAVLCVPCKKLIKQEYEKVLDALCPDIPKPPVETSEDWRLRADLLRYYHRRKNVMTLDDRDQAAVSKIFGNTVPDLNTVSRTIYELHDRFYWSSWLYQEARRARAVETKFDFHALFLHCIEQLRRRDQAA